MKNKQSFSLNKNMIVICIALIIAIFAFYKLFGNNSQENKTQTVPKAQSTISKQTSLEVEVTVEALLKTLSPGSEAAFELIFNTHSVELNYDVAQIARLTDDNGNTYKPLSWTGGKGGHHVEGVLMFPPIADSAKRVTLTIPGINNKDRVFTWDLKR